MSQTLRVRPELTMSSATAGRRTGVPQPDQTTVVIVCGDTEVASWSLVRHGPPDLSTVDELARLALAVRRLGWSLRLRQASGDLWDLLELAGLAPAFVGARPGAGKPAPTDLVVQVGREAEEAEEVGVEEGMEPGDPVP